MNEDDLRDLMREATAKPCPCGSGEIRRILYDARGIECGYVCDACEARTKAKYRPEIFTDPSYYTDEQIEDDY